MAVREDRRQGAKTRHGRGHAFEGGGLPLAKAYEIVQGTLWRRGARQKASEMFADSGKKMAAETGDLAFGTGAVLIVEVEQALHFRPPPQEERWDRPPKWGRA